jgi:hypothetical protein
VDDHAAQVLARQQVVVALVDLLERLALRDDLVELEVTRLVQAEQVGHLEDRV